MRKRRVIRFAILYFIMLVLFVVLIAAPIVVRNMNIDTSLRRTLYNAIGVKSGNSMYLLQPLDKGLNDTQTYYTGSHLPKGFSSHAAVTPTGGNDAFQRLL